MDKLSGKPIVHLFLSYSWADSELANSIDTELSDCGIDVKRDIRDVGAWTSIKSFMSSIKNQDYAVVVISKSYLRSPNCMYEVMELLSTSQYKERILSIVTPDADVYNPISKAVYIKYWEDEAKRLEEAIRPLKLENSAELTLELRKYRSIERTIASFLDLISDKNNPKIVNAVREIKEIIRTNQHIPYSPTSEHEKKSLDIKVEACHYAFLKFATLTDVSNTELEKMVGIKKINDGTKLDEYDLPMLRCEVTNCSEEERAISEPMIEGAIQLKDMEIQGMGFMLIPQSQKNLKPGAKAVFNLHGPVIISIIKALFDNKIECIYVEDNFGFRYYVNPEQLVEITGYFKRYCFDLTELEVRHNKYCI